MIQYPLRKTSIPKGVTKTVAPVRVLANLAERKVDHDLARELDCKTPDVKPLDAA
jgi:hypothetical protein